MSTPTRFFPSDILSVLARRARRGVGPIVDRRAPRRSTRSRAVEPPGERADRKAQGHAAIVSPGTGRGQDSALRFGWPRLSKRATLPAMASPARPAPRSLLLGVSLAALLLAAPARAQDVHVVVRGQTLGRIAK